MNRARALLLVVFVLAMVVGCRAGETTEPSATENTSGKLEVLDAWGRTSPMVAQNGAFYMKIVNGTVEDDELTSAATKVCDVVELHEMYLKENDVMGMRPVEGGVIPIPAGETVELKAGGLHVMCIGKTADFNVGDTYPVTLEFAKAGTMEVTIQIREMGDMPADMNMEEGMEIEEKDVVVQSMAKRLLSPRERHFIGCEQSSSNYYLGDRFSRL